MNNVSKAILIGAALIGLPIAFSAYSTFTSVASAPGRVINKTLGTDNILNNYEYFFDANANYNSRVAQVRQFEGYINADNPADENARLRMELAAMQQSCRELANDYNADSRKLNRNLFKSNDLPYELDVLACELGSK